MQALFVCGEGSALTASISATGMPRVKPPRTVDKGLWEKPTVLNNVETYANVPGIVEGLIGLELSEQRRVLVQRHSPLTGAIENTGLIEVPMGTTLREIIYDIGGGLGVENAEFKAVQIGGPSGGCPTEAQLDEPFDFDSVKKFGAIIGSWTGCYGSEYLYGRGCSFLHELYSERKLW